MSYRMLTALGLLIASLMNPITSLAADDKQSIKHRECFFVLPFCF